MSIPAVKAVEIGTGIAGAALTGSCVHDEIFMMRNSADSAAKPITPGAWKVV